MNGFDAEIVLGGRIHVVSRRHTIPHVRLEHRVVSHAAQFDPVVSEHVCIVFEMVPELGVLLALEQRTQACEDRIPIELCRGADVIMSERNVSSFARLDAERDADDLRLPIVETRRFRIESEQARALERADPAIEVFYIEYGFVESRSLGNARISLKIVRADRRRYNRRTRGISFC